MNTIAALLIYFLSISPEAAGLFNKADSLYKAGKLDAAMTAAACAADRSRELSDTTSLIKALCIQADVLIDKGDDMAAVDYYNKCVDLFPYGEPMFILSSSLFNIATIYYQNGEYDKAEEYVIKSIGIDSKRNFDSILVLRYLLAANIAYEKGDYSRAMEYVAEGRKLLTKRRNANIEGRLMLVNAKCKEALYGPEPDWTVLEDDYRKALETVTAKLPPGYTTFGVNPHAMECNYRLGLVLSAQGKDAREYFMDALANSRLSQPMHGINPLIERDCCQCLADILRRDGDDAGADRYLDRVAYLSYLPYVTEMSNKLSVAEIEFIRREKDRKIEEQRERSSFLLTIASILAIVIVGLLLMNRKQSLQHKQIETKNAQLVKLVLQKDQLIAMLKESSASSTQSAGFMQIESDKIPLPDIRLSKRELEVLGLCCKGLTNKEIAAKLNVSVRTVESHKLNICSKVGVNSTPELIAYAFKSGLIK